MSSYLFEPLDESVGPRGRLRARDLATDRPGRAFDSVGHGRHATGQPVDPLEQETIRFAKTVAERIDAGRKRECFDRLVPVADPRFLGHLRQRLSARVIREALPYRI